MLTNANSGKILTLLRQLGCNEREAHIYLHCLSLGPSSVQHIAHTMKQKRLTVHSAIEQLIEKGFLYESRKGKRRLIVAEQPDTLLKMIKKKQMELDMLSANAEHLIPLLRTIHSPNESIPAIKFYEDIDGLKKMLEETLSSTGDVLVFSYVELLASLLTPEYLETYFKRRADKDIHTRLIFPPCPFAEYISKKSENYNIEVRTLPETYHWQSGIFSWNESIALLSYTKEKVTCTIIDNQDISMFFRNVMFELCWQQSTPVI